MTDVLRHLADALDALKLADASADGWFIINHYVIEAEQSCFRALREIADGQINVDLMTGEEAP